LTVTVGPPVLAASRPHECGLAGKITGPTLAASAGSDPSLAVLFAPAPAALRARSAQALFQLIFGIARWLHNLAAVAFAAIGEGPKTA
jgi:hypothetical protein